MNNRTTTNTRRWTWSYLQGKREKMKDRITPGSHSGAEKTVVRVVPIIIGALGSIKKTLKAN